MSLVSDPDSEELTWDPKQNGIALERLEKRPDKNGILCRVLHYSIQMQMREVGTKYWVKVWSFFLSPGGDHEALTAHCFQAKERDAVFASQHLSQNLAESYRLAPGLEEREIRAGGNAAASSQVLKNPNSNRPESPSLPRRVDLSQFQDRTDRAQSSLVNESSVSNKRPSHQTPPAPPVSTLTTSTVSGAKRTASTHGGRGKLQANSQSPLRTSQPTQRLSTKSGVEYSLGASRHSGGK
jgi:hypothetical protein